MNTTYLMNPHTGTVQSAEDWEADGFTVDNADLIEVVKGENGDWVVTGVLRAACSGDAGLGQHGMTSFDMTLRDYFAAKAMQGLLAAQVHGFNDRPAKGPFASMAYEMADAMLKEREGKK
jgi:hypothetical protein